MTTIADLLTVKLHVGPTGTVWSIYADGPPTDSGMHIERFLMSTFCKEMSQFRLMGTHSNVALILALYTRRLKQGRGSVEVCSPLACGTQPERKNPEIALLSIRRFEQVGSAGGWHSFNQRDHPSYAIANSVSRTTDEIDDTTRRLLRVHPLWPALSFLPNVNHDAVCSLIAEILDPRWFVDVTNINRGSKLRAFLGLRPVMLKTYKGSNAYARRSQLVRDCWFSDYNRKNIERPEYFLYRVYEEVKEKKGELVAITRANQLFIEYLRLIWLSVLAKGFNQPTEDLFVPEMFFKRNYEAKAYKRHMETVGDE